MLNNIITFAPKLMRVVHMRNMNNRMVRTIVTNKNKDISKKEVNILKEEVNILKEELYILKKKSDTSSLFIKCFLGSVLGFAGGAIFPIMLICVL